MTIPLLLTAEQHGLFDQFLLDGTANTLTALDTVFELSIDCSGSSIEVAPAKQNENLKNFGSGPLYIISSALAGEVSGSIVLLLRDTDFKELSEVMKPVLSLLFLSAPDTDLGALDRKNPAGGGKNREGLLGDSAYRELMMDSLTEMGNVLIGLYAKSIHKICGLSTHHSLPLIMKDPHQTVIRQILYSPSERDRFHVVIENELYLEDKTIKLWCLISPTRDSFSDILSSLDKFS